MDLNPQPPAEWTAHGPYEVANHCLKTHSNILIMLNAWLDTKEDEENDCDWLTVNYWAARLRPLWVKTVDSGSSNSSDDAEESSSEDTVRTADDGVETLVVICNRSGEENGNSLRFPVKSCLI